MNPFDEISTKQSSNPFDSIGTDTQTLEDTSREAIFKQNAPEQYQAIQDYKQTPIGQMGQDIQSGLKGLYGDIKSNLTGQKQSPEEMGLLNRTFQRFGQAGQDIGEAFKGATAEEFAQQMIPGQTFTPTETEKKLATAISKPFTGTAGDIITSGAKTLMTDERQQELKDLIQSQPVQDKIKLAEEYFSKIIPNPTDRDFIMEALNYVPVPILDDMLSGASRGLKFEAGQSLKQGLKTGAENVVSAIKTPEVIKQGASNLSDRILTNANRMTKGDISKFQAMTGETPGEFLNNRGITQTGEDLFDTLRANAQKSVQNADEAVSLVEGNYKMPETMTSKGPVDYVETMLKDNLDKSEKIGDASGSLRNAELLRKYQEGGLTLKDITEGQRYMQRNNKFTYVDKGSDRAQLVTNIDSQVRKWKFDVAEENGFTNWKTVNKETQAYNNLLEKMTGWAKGVEGNNPISLTDWLAFSADPKVYLAKQLMDSAWFKEMMVRGLNKVAQREGKLPLAELDKEAIIREQVKKRYGLDNSGSRTPTVESARRAEIKALPSGEGKTSSANVVDVKPIEVGPRGSNPPDITSRSIIRDPRIIIEGVTPPAQIAKIKLERALMNINAVPDGVEKAIAEIAGMVADGKLTPDDILSIEETLRKAGLYLDENGNVLPITENTVPTPKEEAKIEAKKKLKAKTEKKVKTKPKATEVVSTPETVKEAPLVQEDWTKRDMTTSPKTETVDKFGNTIVSQPENGTIQRSIELDGTKYREMDLPDTTKEWYLGPDDKVYEYKDGKMVAKDTPEVIETPKTPQVEGKTVGFTKKSPGVYEKTIGDREIRVSIGGKDIYPNLKDGEYSVSIHENKLKPDGTWYDPGYGQSGTYGSKEKIMKFLEKEGIDGNEFFPKPSSTPMADGNIGITKKEFIEATKGQHNSIRDIGGIKVARVDFHDGKEWKIVTTDNFDDISPDTRVKGNEKSKKIIAEFETREELMNYLYNKKSLPLSSKSEVKEAPKTPQVEGKTAMEAKLDATINKKLIEEAKKHTDFVDFFQSKLGDKQPTKDNLMKLGFSAEDIARNTDSLGISLEDLFYEIKTGKLSSYPAKQPLPLSQKSEVKYSKPIEDNLIKEAKKYKSAEEFVKAQGKTVYHGTQGDFEVFAPKSPTERLAGKAGTYFTTNLTEASGFGKNIKEVHISPNAKIKVEYANDMPAEIKAERIFQARREGYDAVQLKSVQPLRGNRAELAQVNKEINELKPKIDELNQRMLDGEITPEQNLSDPLMVKWSELLEKRNPTHTIVFNTDIIKTKSQLTDIWNKANKVTPETSLIQEAKKYKSAEEFVDKVIPKNPNFRNIDSENIGIGTLNLEDIKSSWDADTFARNRDIPIENNIGLLSEYKSKIKKIEKSPLGRQIDKPILVKKNINGGKGYRIYDGNHRYLQALKNGDTEIPVVFLDNSGGIKLIDIYNKANKK